MPKNICCYPPAQMDRGKLMGGLYLLSHWTCLLCKQLGALLNFEYLEVHIMVEWKAAAACVLLHTKDLFNDVRLKKFLHLIHIQHPALIW